MFEETGKQLKASRGEEEEKDEEEAGKKTVVKNSLRPNRLETEVDLVVQVRHTERRFENGGTTETKAK